MEMENQIYGKQMFQAEVVGGRGGTETMRHRVGTSEFSPVSCIFNFWENSDKKP